MAEEMKSVMAVWFAAGHETAFEMKRTAGVEIEAHSAAGNAGLVPARPVAPRSI
jgi:hypothetical protein